MEHEFLKKKLRKSERRLFRHFVARINGSAAAAAAAEGSAEVEGLEGEGPPGASPSRSQADCARDDDSDSDSDFAGAIARAQPSAASAVRIVDADREYANYLSEQESIRVARALAVQEHKKHYGGVPKHLAAVEEAQAKMQTLFTRIYNAPGTDPTPHFPSYRADKPLDAPETVPQDQRDNAFGGYNVSGADPTAFSYRADKPLDAPETVPQDQRDNAFGGYSASDADPTTYFDAYFSSYLDPETGSASYSGSGASHPVPARALKRIPSLRCEGGEFKDPAVVVYAALGVEAPQHEKADVSGATGVASGAAGVSSGAADIVPFLSQDFSVPAPSTNEEKGQNTSRKEERDRLVQQLASRKGKQTAAAAVAAAVVDATLIDAIAAEKMREVDDCGPREWSAKFLALKLSALDALKSRDDA